MTNLIVAETVDAEFEEVIKSNYEPDSVTWLCDRMKSHPLEFEQTCYVLVWKPTKLEIWTCNGFWFYNFYNGGPEFTFIDKCKFHRAYRRWLPRAVRAAGYV